MQHASLLASLFSPQINTTLPTGDGRIVRVVERPGLWMDDAELEDLSESLRTIAAKTLPAEGLTYGVFAGDKAVYSRTVITLVKDETGRPVAFNALAIMDVELGGETTEVLHLGLVMVDPDERSKGLSWVLYGLTCVLLFLRGNLRPLWISNVTQVPAIVGMVSGTFSNVFPSPGTQDRRSLRHLLLARSIMGCHRTVFGVGPEAPFDEDNFIIRDAYTGGSDGLKKRFDDAAKHRDEVHNRFCAEVLDYDRGDDVLQLGQIDMAAMSRYLFRSVPRRSLIGLLATGALVILQRAVLPLAQWFDTSRRYGDLRPRS